MSWNFSAFADEAGPSCDEQIAALRKAGMKFIDIRGIDGHNIAALPVDHARVVRKKLDDAGITVGMFGSPVGKIDIKDDFEVETKHQNSKMNFQRNCLWAFLGIPFPKRFF